jgi:hypothetical protein
VNNFRATDPETSREAGLSLDQAKVTKLMRNIYDMLSVSPMYDEQLIRRYNLLREMEGWDMASPSGIRTRRSDLVKLGWVKDSGDRAVLPSGRKSIVWKAVENV